MKKLEISPSRALPLEWIQLATVVYGARGSGKTSFGRVAAEEVTKAGQRFCAIDLKGDWYGLRSSADGKREGIPVVIFGGEHADVPLEPGAGKFVGETVAKLGQSCILDFELFSKGKQIRFLADFCEALYHTNREPLLLLLDEAQRYAPQFSGRGGDVDIARCLGAVTDLVKLGRKHGIGPVLFTQRGAGLSKEVSELCDVMVAFRTPGTLDQDRIREWLWGNLNKVSAERLMESISSLPTGDAIFASAHPELPLNEVNRIRLPETFDSSATPKIGKKRIEPKKLAKPDLEVLRVKMAEAIERAKEDDPKALRARLAVAEKSAADKEKEIVYARKALKDLSDRVTSLSHEVVNLSKPAAPVEVPMFDVEAFESLKRYLGEQVTLALNNVRGEMHRYKSVCLENAKAKPGSVIGAPRPGLRKTSPPPPPVPLPEPAEPEHRPPTGELSVGQLAVLSAIAGHDEGATRSQLRTLTGYRKSTVNRLLSELMARRSVTRDGDRFLVTGLGISAMGDRYEPPLKGRALYEKWMAKLGEGQRAVLTALSDAYPHTLTREELDGLTGYAKSTRNRLISELHAARCIVTSGNLVAMSREFAE